MTEEEIIACLYEHDPDGGQVRFDDCGAVPEAPDLIVTTDLMIEGTHFRREWSTPENLAHKLFQANLSDLCADGCARAHAAILQLGLPDDLPGEFVPQFAAALAHQLQSHSTRLIGGDTCRSQQLLLGLTLFGKTQRRVLRAGGQPGDTVYVTGPLGTSQLGLEVLEGRHPNLPTAAQQLALEGHLQPHAQTNWAQAVQSGAGVHASMDLSDGLFIDAPKLALASQVQLNIALEKLPTDPTFETILEPAPLEQAALYGGEDYQILFLAPGWSAAVPAFAIGEVGAGAPGVRYLRHGQVVPVEPGGFSHFDRTS